MSGGTFAELFVIANMRLSAVLDTETKGQFYVGKCTNSLRPMHEVGLRGTSY